MHPALPTLSLIISNDFLILTKARRCFFSRHPASPTQIFYHSSCLIFQFCPPHTPPQSGLLLTRSLFIYSFFISAETHSSPGSIGLHGEVSFSSLTRCRSVSMVVKTQPLCTPFAKSRIRRIMAVTDFHQRSVVYHSGGKSLLTQFAHMHCKMWCQMMLDGEQGADEPWRANGT